MPENYRKVTEFKTVSAFRDYLNEQKIKIGLCDTVPGNGSAALAKKVTVLGREVGNRWAILPMEGWDCEKDGSPSVYTRRRWLRFAESGAKLICGTEAAAVMHSGRSNPNQLLCAPNTLEALKKMCAEMRTVHKEKFGRNDDLLIGLQLTHSGRYAHPNEPMKLESVTAYAHPLLDIKYATKFGHIATDDELRDIIAHFIEAAKTAQNAGFDFVDIKSAHGYLGHELLTAYDRPGPFGGSFENRTRFFREIADGIKKACPGLGIMARVSIFDIMPFVKGGDGVGKPMDWHGAYPYAFGGDGTGMGMDPDLKEPAAFINMMKSEYGTDLICATIGSPYYNVHMQRPAYYPVSDGYLMPEHPLYNVSRHLAAVARIRELCPGVKFVGSGYTCLQEYLPNAAEYQLANDLTDFVGIGRMVISYPQICSDVLSGRSLDRCHICRTFGDCTSAPRAGMISGCFPLDEFYKKLPEAARLKEIKKGLKS